VRTYGSVGAVGRQRPTATRSWSSFRRRERPTGDIGLMARHRRDRPPAWLAVTVTNPIDRTGFCSSLNLHSVAHADCIPQDAVACVAEIDRRSVIAIARYGPACCIRYTGPFFGAFVMLGRATFLPTRGTVVYPVSQGVSRCDDFPARLRCILIPAGFCHWDRPRSPRVRGAACLFSPARPRIGRCCPPVPSQLAISCESGI
jgi:hypothetical protein